MVAPCADKMSVEKQIAVAKAMNQGRIFLVVDFISCAPLSCFNIARDSLRKPFGCEAVPTGSMNQ
jgi:hypothetical protein